MSSLVAVRTMSEVVGELGVDNPNCAGIPPILFLGELGDDKLQDQDNHAMQICNRCEGRPSCQIALGEVSIASILISEGY